jgi:hypothetical protein
MARPIIYPIEHSEIYRTGLGIQDPQAKTFYFLSYLSASRRGELVAWERAYRKVYKKTPEGKTALNRNGSPIVEDLAPVPDNLKKLPGVTLGDFSTLPKPCGCVRPTVNIAVLKTRGKIKPRVAPLIICPHSPDLVGIDPLEVADFLKIDKTIFAHVKAYLDSLGTERNTPVFTYSPEKLYKLIRGTTRKVKGGYVKGEFVGGLKWHTKVALPTGQIIETEVSPDTKTLRASRITNLLKLGFRKSTILNLTGHSSERLLNFYDRFLPEERANRF